MNEDQLIEVQKELEIAKALLELQEVEIEDFPTYLTDEFDRLFEESCEDTSSPTP
jgi:hypothetical protein